MHWPGNLKKYRILNNEIVDSNNVAAVDPATGFFKTTAQSFWTVGPDGNNVELGGAANNLPDPSIRKVYTNITADNDLTKTDETIATIDAMVDGLNDHDIDNMGRFFSESFRWIGNAGCGPHTRANSRSSIFNSGTHRNRCRNLYRTA